MSFEITRITKNYKNPDGVSKTEDELESIKVWYRIIGDDEAHQNIVINKEVVDNLSISTMRELVKEEINKEEIVTNLKDESLEEEQSIDSESEVESEDEIVTEEE